MSDPRPYDHHRRLEHYLDALRTDPNAPAPPGLDETLAAFARRAVQAESAHLEPGQRLRMWNRALADAQHQVRHPQGEPSIHPSPVQEGRNRPMYAIAESGPLPARAPRISPVSVVLPFVATILIVILAAGLIDRLPSGGKPGGNGSPSPVMGAAGPSTTPEFTPTFTPTVVPFVVTSTPIAPSVVQIQLAETGFALIDNQLMLPLMVTGGEFIHAYSVFIVDQTQGVMLSSLTLAAPPVEYVIVPLQGLFPTQQYLIVVSPLNALNQPLAPSLEFVYSLPGDVTFPPVLPGTVMPVDPSLLPTILPPAMETPVEIPVETPVGPGVVLTVIPPAVFTVTTPVPVPFSEYRLTTAPVTMVDNFAPGIDSLLYGFPIPSDGWVTATLRPDTPGAAFHLSYNYTFPEAVGETFTGGFGGSSGGSEPANDPSLFVGVQQGGMLYVNVTRDPGERADRFTLIVAHGQATPIRVGEGTPGALRPEAQAAFFLLEPRSDGVVDIDVKSDGQTDLYLTVIELNEVESDAGVAYAYNTSITGCMQAGPLFCMDEDGGARFDPELTDVPLREGKRYMLIVRSRYNPAVSEFTVKVTAR